MGVQHLSTILRHTQDDELVRTAGAATRSFAVSSRHAMIGVCCCSFLFFMLLNVPFAAPCLRSVLSAVLQLEVVLPLIRPWWL